MADCGTSQWQGRMANRDKDQTTARTSDRQLMPLLTNLTFHMASDRRLTQTANITPLAYSREYMLLPLTDVHTSLHAIGLPLVRLRPAITIVHNHLKSMADAKKPTICFANCNMSITAEAMEYLARSTKGRTYYDIFMSILRRMTTEPCTVASGFGKVTLQPGQVALSNEELAAQYGLNPKTMKSIVNEMARLHLLALHRTTTTTVIDMVCLSGWYKDGRYTRNPFYLHSRQSVPSASPRTSSVRTNPSGTQNAPLGQSESPQ